MYKVERSCMKGHERSQRVSQLTFLTGQSLVRLVSFVLFFICAIRVIVFHCPLSLLPTTPHSLDDSPAEHRKQQTDLREIVVQICHPKVGKYNMYVYIYIEIVYIYICVCIYYIYIYGCLSLQDSQSKTCTKQL